MDGERSWKRTDETEINLVDLLRMLCMRWKQMAACALVFAVMAGGYGYIKNKGDGQPVDTMQEEQENLTEEELLAVEEALQLSAEVNRLQEYIDHSILMQVDPYQKAKVVSLYGIEGASYQELIKITESYLNYLVNGGAAAALAAADSKTWDMDVQYLAEAVQAWQRTDGSSRIISDKTPGDGIVGTVLYIETDGTDEKMAQQMAEGIQAVLQQYSQDVKKTCGKHVLSLLGSEESIVIDSGLGVQQHEKRELLKSYRASLGSMTDALNSLQKAVYDNKSGQLSTSAEDVQEHISGSGFSAKYLILGGAAGIFAYSVLFVLWYLLQDTIKSTSEFQACYSLPFYGMISLKKGKKEQDMQENEKERILSRIRIACKKHGIHTLCLASEFLPVQSEKLCLESLADRLREWGIDTIFAEDTSHAAMWDQAAEAGTVLMICRIGSSTHRMVHEAMGFYIENGIRVLGAALLESDA